MDQEPAADGRTSKSQRTRRALIDAARHVAQREGLSSVTLDRVAEEAGVSKGGLLYHFESKRHLLNALLVDSLTTTNRELEALTEDSKPGAFARAYLEFVRTGAHQAGGVATGVFASAALEEGELSPARAMFAEWQQRLVDNDGLDPTVALLARVVGDGLWLIDLFDLAPPEPQPRNELINLVQQLLDAES